ncbi:YjbF family lipoprotein [Pseudorhodobacter sp. W20_MBD10_FR17]|uniref:YjbF family lipoprotein n=1 Tax=Pseudorhodobacter sp. W20_MBD10_FR17 TaxID=3240266 RepID=UPI003F954BE8
MKLNVPRMVLQLLLAIFGMSACSSETEGTGTAVMYKAVIAATQAGMGAKDSPASASLGVTRAALQSIAVPLKLVTIESRGAQAAIFKIGANGNVETWASQDKKSLSMRNGIIVASRGLGEDLMSAAVPKVAQLQHENTTHLRVHTVLDGEDKPVQLQFECRMIGQVAETITVVERNYATHRTTETCSGPSGRFSNTFWIEAGGKIRKSHQFLSNSIGYVTVEQLQ